MNQSHLVFPGFFFTFNLHKLGACEAVRYLQQNGKAEHASIIKQVILYLSYLQYLNVTQCHRKGGTLRLHHSFMWWPMDYL